MPLVTESKKGWKLPLGKKEDERCHGIKETSPGEKSDHW